MNISKTISPLLVSFAVAILFAACGGGSGYGTSTGAMTGTLGVSLTDAPSCGFDHVYVTVSKVRVHQSSNMNISDTDPGWYDITLSAPARIDLLNLTNGVLYSLGTTTLPAGQYQQVRLMLVANTGNSAPYANSIVPTGGAETPLTTPSGMQSGIKLINQFTVAANTRVDLVLDFNACKSVVTAGNSGMYIMKPVVTMMPTVVSGTIEGWVDPVLAASTPVAVSAQVASGMTIASVKATVADPVTGKFVLAPVLESSMLGNYNIVITANNHATAVVSGIGVSAASTVDVNTSGNPILLDASVMHTVSGTVSVAGITTNIDAVVQALQTLSSSLQVEAAMARVDLTTGNYSLSLPVAAPQYASYVSSAMPLVFTSASASAGQYTLSGTLATGIQQSVNVNMTPGNMTSNFAF